MKHFKKTLGITLCLLVRMVFLSAAITGSDLIVTENGKIYLDIVIPDNAVFVTRMASEELKYFLDRATGLKFKIVTESMVTAEKGIFLGSTKALQKRTDLSSFESQQYVIIVEKNNIFIAGKDDPRTNPIDGLTLLHYVNDKATLYGVYSFLEKFCDIRFFSPGDDGLYVPKFKRISLAPAKFIEKPFFSERIIGHFTGYNMVKYPDAASYFKGNNDEIYLWGLRLKLSAKGPSSGCHSEQFFNSYYTNAHPEYFSLQPDGSRNLRYFCWSSPAVINLWVKMADAYFSGKSPASAGLPFKEWTGCYFKNEFMIDPMDCYEKYICQCPACKKFIAGRGELGAGELVFSAINKITAAVTQTHPDKFISTTIYPPKSIFPKDSEIHKNLIVRYCTIGPEQQAFLSDYTESLQLLKQWSSATSKKIPLWIYTCIFHFGNVLPMVPDTCPRGFSRFLAEVKDYSSGFFVEHYAATLTMKNFDNYIQARLLWDPGLNVEVLSEEYFSKFYGPAAFQVKSFFSRLEINCQRILEAVAKEGKYDLIAAPVRVGDILSNRKFWQEYTWKNIYDDKEMNLLNQLLTDAEKMTSVLSQKEYLKRVTLLRQYILELMQNERDKIAGVTAPIKSQTSNPRVQTYNASAKGGLFFKGVSPGIDCALDKGVEKMELGLKFKITKSGTIKTFYLYQAKIEIGPHQMRLWGGNDFTELITAVTVPEKNGGGWSAVELSEPIEVTEDEIYILSYTATKGIAETLDVFASPIELNGITALSGLYSMTEFDEKAPNQKWRNCNYFIDIDFKPDSD